MCSIQPNWAGASVLLCIVTRDIGACSLEARLHELVAVLIFPLVVADLLRRAPSVLQVAGLETVANVSCVVSHTAIVLRTSGKMGLPRTTRTWNYVEPHLKINNKSIVPTCSWAFAYGVAGTITLTHN